MDVRVRLVFADAVKHHVQRRYGFSSCWYLLPADMKIVGDLAHALLREFGLQKRCPQGLELMLEELPVLASQSIRIVRDNDTIVVQSPVLLMREEEEEEEVPDSETASSEGEKVENQKLLKRKARGKTDREPRLKKFKVVESAVKGGKKRQGVEKESRGSVVVGEAR
uniref:Coilin N-terminal domain-containing protein n=1 Tax=Peronospora matthiolae TaxID=2874970 RepID=A0AAV1UZ38_9STRA